MINFKNKYIRVLSLALLCFMIWDTTKSFRGIRYNDISNINVNSGQRVDAKMNIEIDPKKEVKDYSLIEKAVYFFMKDSIDKIREKEAKNERRAFMRAKLKTHKRLHASSQGEEDDDDSAKMEQVLDSSDIALFAIKSPKYDKIYNLKIDMKGAVCIIVGESDLTFLEEDSDCKFLKTKLVNMRVGESRIIEMRNQLIDFALIDIIS